MQYLYLLALTSLANFRGSLGQGKLWLLCTTSAHEELAYKLKLYWDCGDTEDK